MSKYRPLQEYLQSQSAPKVELSFHEIEEILGQQLPPSAYAARWWSNGRNARTAPPWQLAWQNAGYDAMLRTGLDRVEFRRLRRVVVLPTRERSASIVGD